MKLTAVAAVVMLAVLACAAIAQPPPALPPGPGQGPAVGPPGGGPGPGPGMGPRMNPEQMLDRMADRIGLTASEKAAAKKAVAAKMEAGRAHGDVVRALGEAARKENPTDAELRTALKKFETSLAAYRQKANAIDAALMKALSLKSQARLVAYGVIDNGLPRMGMGRRGGMGGDGAPGQNGGGFRQRRAPGGAPAPGPN